MMLYNVMTMARYVKKNIISCACGCEQTLNGFDLKNRPRKYIHGHSCAGWNKGVHRYLGGKRFEKGRTPWNKGKKGVMPEPWNKGKPFSEESKKKMSNSHKGKRHSPKTEFKKGIVPWNKGLFGPENPNWKEHKVTPIKKWLRYHQKYINWHHQVMIRDNYICQICKVRGGKLCVDHFPKSFEQVYRENKHRINDYKDALLIKQFWDINNGRVLCVSCHKTTPTFGRCKKGGFVR